MTDVVRQHIEVVPGARAPKARIAGHRIRVQDVAVWHERLGLSPDEIVDQHPAISLADVHAALAYYWDHREEIERAIDDERTFTEEFQRTHSGPLEAKLAQRRLA